MKDKYYLIVMKDDKRVVSHRITWNVNSDKTKDMHFCPVIFDTLEEAEDYTKGFHHEIKEITLKDYNKQVYYGKTEDKRRTKCVNKNEG